MRRLLALLLLALPAFAQSKFSLFDQVRPAGVGRSLTLGAIYYTSSTSGVGQISQTSPNVTTTKKYLYTLGNGSVFTTIGYAQVGFPDLSGLIDCSQLPPWTGDATYACADPPANALVVSLSNVVTAGSCGDATHSCGLTYDAKGRITAATNNVISGGGGSTPTGTGFVHVTAGVQDAAAVAVDLTTGDVTGILPLTGGGVGADLSAAVGAVIDDGSVMSTIGSAGLGDIFQGDGLGNWQSAGIASQSDNYVIRWRASSNSYVAALVAEASMSLSDVTMWNASTSAHGFLKKLDNNPAHYMDGQGNWTSPSTPNPVVKIDSFSCNSSTTAWSASGTPVSGGTLYVARDGAVAATSYYSVSGTTLTVTPACATGSVLTWGYYTTAPSGSTPLREQFTAAGGTDFTLAHTPSTISDVDRDGIVQASTAWSLISPATVRFTSAPASGAIIGVAYTW